MSSRMVNSTRLRCHYTELRRRDVTVIGRGQCNADFPGTTKTSTGKMRVGNRKKEKEKEKNAACRRVFGSHTKYQTITTRNWGIMSVQVMKRDGAQCRRISGRTWVTILCGIRKVFESVWHKMNLEKKQNTPLYVWNEMMRIEWQHETHSKYARSQWSRFKFGQYLVTLSFYIYICW